MGRAQSAGFTRDGYARPAGARRSPTSPPAVFASSDEVKACVREAVAETLGCPCEPGDKFGDFPDYFHPDSDSEISLCLELLGDTLSVTRISCEPQGQGLGRRVVDAICASAGALSLVLEIPDPFESSLPFWAQFGGRNVGIGERVILRLYEPAAQTPAAV